MLLHAVVHGLAEDCLTLLPPHPTPHPFPQVNWAYGGSAACPDVSMGGAFSGASPGGNMTAAGTMGPGGTGGTAGMPPGNFTGMPGNGTGLMPGGGGGQAMPLSTTNTTQLYLEETQAQLAGADRVIAFWIGGRAADLPCWEQVLAWRRHHVTACCRFACPALPCPAGQMPLGGRPHAAEPSCALMLCST